MDANGTTAVKCPFNCTPSYSNNSTNNISITSTDNAARLQIEEWLLVSCFLFILIVGVLGNSFVIYVFGYRRKKVGRSTTELLILLLGITDFLSTIFNCSLYVYWTMTRHKQWHFGYLGCKILPALGPVLITASSGIIIIFCLDRYVAIVEPFRGQLSTRTAVKAYIINILLSILSYAHYIYNIELRNGACSLGEPTHLPYGIPNCVLIILRLSVFAIVFLYTSMRILLKLRRHENSPSHSRKTKSGTSQKKRESRHCQSLSISRMLFMMGLIFILLVFPRELFYLVINMSHLISSSGIAINTLLLNINSWLKIMHTANCCANVFIYAHMHERFRRIVLTFMGCFQRNKQDLSRYDSIAYKTRSEPNESSKF